MNYTGDLSIEENADGDYDLCFENGQPCMTDGLDTYVILAVYGEDYWGNATAKSEAEKMKSEFPSVIKRNVVTDKTKNDGCKAIEKALAPAVSEKIARNIAVTGEIINANTIGWKIDIEGIDNSAYKYFINWSKGAITAKIVRG
jgi:phage gp46-like protein